MPIEGVQIKGMSQADIARVSSPTNRVTLTEVADRVAELAALDVNNPRRNNTTPTETPTTGVSLSGRDSTSDSSTSLAFRTPIGSDAAIYRSLLHYILIKKIQIAAVEQATTAIMTQSFSIQDLDKYVSVTDLPVSFNLCYLYELGVTRRDEDGQVLNGSGIEDGPSEVFFAYIKMGLFIEILNNVVLRDRTVPIFSFNTAGDSSTFDMDFYKGNRFATHKDHVSIDPAVCLLPRNNHFGGDETGNRIYEIYLNVDFLIKTLNNLMSDNPEVDLITYLEAITAGVERVTGNFNEFQVQYFEESHSFAVVDRKYLQKTTLADIPEINIIGTGSVVKSFNLNSLLSPQISKMVAISAQVGGTDLGLEATAFKKLNEGLRDSVIRNRAVGNFSKENSEEDEKARKNELLARIEWYLSELYTYSRYVPDDVENIVTDYIMYTKQILGEEDKPEYNFILPFELTLVLEGISGFRVMESFRVNPQILPKMYLTKTATRVAFIVTGLEQKVTKAGWDTIVKAQMYMLPSGTAAADSTNNILASRLRQQKRRTGERSTKNFKNADAYYYGTEKATLEETVSFLTDVLKGFGISSPNQYQIQFMKIWKQAERSQAAWNPLNTTLDREGATPHNDAGTTFVRNFTSRAQGVEATISTFTKGNGPARYNGLLTAIKAITNEDGVTAAMQALHNTPWGTKFNPIKASAYKTINNLMYKTPIKKRS